MAWIARAPFVVATGCIWATSLSLSALALTSLSRTVGWTDAPFVYALAVAVDIAAAYFAVASAYARVNGASHWLTTGALWALIALSMLLNMLAAHDAGHERYPAVHLLPPLLAGTFLEVALWQGAKLVQARQSRTEPTEVHTTVHRDTTPALDASHASQNGHAPRVTRQAKRSGARPTKAQHIRDAVEVVGRDTGRIREHLAEQGVAVAPGTIRTTLRRM